MTKPAGPAYKRKESSFYPAGNEESKVFNRRVNTMGLHFWMICLVSMCRKQHRDKGGDREKTAQLSRQELLN